MLPNLLCFPFRFYCRFLFVSLNSMDLVDQIDSSLVAWPGAEPGTPGRAHAGPGACRAGRVPGRAGWAGRVPGRAGAGLAPGE